MAQVEDPANLERQGNLAYRLITLILIRCGLRITDATTIPSGCVVRDADEAPYLKYYNRKMKREALVPVDEELEALIARQRERNRERWPDGTPVLFPRPSANIDGSRPIRSSTYRTGSTDGWMTATSATSTANPSASPRISGVTPWNGPDQPRRPAACRAEDTRSRFR